MTSLKKARPAVNLIFTIFIFLSASLWANESPGGPKRLRQLEAVIFDEGEAVLLEIGYDKAGRMNRISDLTEDANTPFVEILYGGKAEVPRQVTVTPPGGWKKQSVIAFEYEEANRIGSAVTTNDGDSQTSDYYYEMDRLSRIDWTGRYGLISHHYIYEEGRLANVTTQYPPAGYGPDSTYHGIFYDTGDRISLIRQTDSDLRYVYDLEFLYDSKDGLYGISVTEDDEPKGMYRFGFGEDGAMKSISITLDGQFSAEINFHYEEGAPHYPLTQHFGYLDTGSALMPDEIIDCWIMLSMLWNF